MRLKNKGITITTFIGLVLIFGLSGCGNKGDLYIPDKSKEVKSEQSQQGDDYQDHSV